MPFHKKCDIFIFDPVPCLGPDSPITLLGPRCPNYYDMKPLSASKARKIAADAKLKGMTPQRQAILDRIKLVASFGRSSIELTEYLTEDDYKWLTGLGYKVTAPTIKYFIPLSPLSDHHIDPSYNIFEAGKLEW